MPLAPLRSSESGELVPKGSAVLVSGSQVVAGLDINPNTAIVIVSRASSGAGVPRAVNVTNTQFTIQSSDAGDAGIINWVVIP
jgi:hypothetical protein